MLEIGQKYRNKKSGSVLQVINIVGNKIEYNFYPNKSTKPYDCTEQQFKEWIINHGELI